VVDAQLEALSVETRRAIYTMLLERPRSVGDLADRLPVSRPAVSQHLKVLLEAGLARVTSVGNRRVYSADPQGMAALRDWVDRMWDMAMGSFADFAQKESTLREMERDMDGDRLEPVVKVITVPGSPTIVFELFTDRMAEWWPLETHSVGQADAVGVRVEPGVGGRVIETTKDGAEHEWAEIKEWEPGRRLGMDWYPGLPVEQATHLEITFRRTAEGTEMTLVHDGWEARGVDAARMREGYETGWDLVLGRIPGSVRAAASA
jgi:DNA-binding transcriptional ArsR family regulator